MKKIGLIGEDPNDTEAIKNLLKQKHPDALQFRHLLKNKRGHQLNNPRVKNALKVEYEEQKPHLVIFIKDADCIVTEKEKTEEVNKWYNDLNPVVNNKGILLMNIYELEALILADIKTFNEQYGTEIQYSKNVMYQTKPKEFLFHKTEKKKKKYTESDCPEIFKKLRIDTIIENCNYFKSFYTDFKLRVK